MQSLFGASRQNLGVVIGKSVGAVSSADDAPVGFGGGWFKFRRSRGSVEAGRTAVEAGMEAEQVV